VRGLSGFFILILTAASLAVSSTQLEAKPVAERAQNDPSRAVEKMTDKNTILPPYLWVPTSDLQISDLIHRTIKETTEKLQSSPANAAMLHFQRGSAYWSNCQAKLAAENFEKAISLDGNFGDAYAARSFLELWNGKRAEAIADADKAIAASPKSFAGYLVKACVVAWGPSSYEDGMKKNREAIEWMSKAIAVQGDLADLYLARAIFRSAVGDLNGSILDATKAIDLRPDFASAYQQRSGYWKCKGNPKKEADDLSAAGEILKGSYGSYNVAVAARMDLERGDLRKAGKRSDSALMIDPKNEDALKVSAESLKKAGRYREAISTYDRALSLKPDDDAELLLGKADALRLAGRHAEARTIIDSLINRCNDELKQDPENAGAYYVRALAYKFTGKHNESRADMENFKKHFKLQF
jgi:tetratricopeptide (TPR) repeat protein